MNDEDTVRTVQREKKNTRVLVVACSRVVHGARYAQFDLFCSLVLAGKLGWGKRLAVSTRCACFVVGVVTGGAACEMGTKVTLLLRHVFEFCVCTQFSLDIVLQG